MAKIRLIPQTREFYTLFDRAAQNLVTTSQLLLDLLENYPDRGDLVGQIKDREHEGDSVTHDIVQLVNKTFVTPIDGEDIYDLATSLDDVCDFMDEVADELNLYGVDEVPREAIEQAGVIVKAVAKLADRLGDQAAQRRLVVAAALAHHDVAHVPTSRRAGLLQRPHLLGRELHVAEPVADLLDVDAGIVAPLDRRQDQARTGGIHQRDGDRLPAARTLDGIVSQHRPALQAAIDAPADRGGGGLHGIGTTLDLLHPGEERHGVLDQIVAVGADDDPLRSPHPAQRHGQVGDDEQQDRGGHSRTDRDVAGLGRCCHETISNSTV
jgi:hypothetical protein